MDMKAFSDENVARCTAKNGFNHPLDSWSLSDWMVATMGELGEAANVLKKLNRVRDGIPGNSETRAQLRDMFVDELADTYIYLDLTCRSVGRDAPWLDGPVMLRQGLSDSMVYAMTQLGTMGALASLGRESKASFYEAATDITTVLRELSAHAGRPLEVAIRSKFDRTSVKIGYVT